MNITAFAIERKKLTTFFSMLLLIGGIFAYQNLGRLEDPNFTVKTAVIMTLYPGANPIEVEQEVTNIIEKALQEMPQLDNIYSLSKAGMSIIKVDMKQTYWADRLPQVWDEMRKKIRDVKGQLPANSMPSEIMDDFSFVYGFVLSITGDGYSYEELEDYADVLKKELGLLREVSRAELWGVQPKVIYVDISEAQIAGLGITEEAILATLANQNFVVNAGAVNLPERRIRIEVKGEFDSYQDIGDVLIRRSFLDVGVNVARDLSEDRGFNRVTDTEMIRLGDIANIRLGYLEPAFTLMRFNGEPALAISLANDVESNIINTGKALNDKIDELVAEFPAGINVTKFQWQSDLVKESINAFAVNLAEAVLIVLVVLTIAMGWRMGIVIGAGLVLTILGTFIVMLIMNIELHRVSLGALVVALGMMVDNSIVVADGVSVRLSKGMPAKKAAIESATIPAMPLLGATIIASMAFYPVFSAKTDAGEYAQTLFLVVAISLMLSWLISVTITPLQCIRILKAPENQRDDPYGSGFFTRFKAILVGLIKYRMFTFIALIAMLAVSVFGFGKIPQQFFPDSTRAQFIVDYWAPEGTPIESVSENLKRIEAKLLDDDRTADIGTFIGSGGPRFYLPVDPEFPYQSYAQIIVNTPSFTEVNPLVDEMEPWLEEQFPDILTRVRKYTVGPGDTWPFELRITGPVDADLTVLRELAGQVTDILHNNPHSKHVRTDMRQRVQKIEIAYSQDRARWAAVTRANIASATSRAYDGMPIGIYRKGTDTYPIIARNINEERSRAAGSLDVIQVKPTLSLKSIPISEVTERIELKWEDPIVSRWNRRRQVAIQAQPDGETFQALRAEVIDDINQITLPPGYQFEWDGEYKSTFDAQMSLIPGMAPTLVIILLIIVALFNAYRPPIIMFLAIPFSLIGITALFWPTGTAFGFMALLGAMSLVGMMIKNSIVLLDEINLNIAEGMESYDAVVMAAVSRLRPVLLAALTTVLGVIPLLQDAFWVSMAMCIMSGLTAGTAITMLLVPVLYVTLYKVKTPD
ncbi:efflux RND transporter permease subunit [Thalassotalea sp. Y01]|uniref:efflux RND transporter permease subunit n=1 Tax=Thalassotalea sp. Y01 TaxID=2729613 RepID=UPI00145F3A24|nr:efflux RND transporter permease subunit [Thalassotalea sp. Y01]NMP15333.1 efflux RND transporter permease subunit [Thalassotalea sp. Y01]